MRIIAAVLYLLGAMLYSYPERWIHYFKYPDEKKRQDANYYSLQRLVRNLLKLLGIHMEVQGSTIYEEPVVYIGNHRSNFDSLMMIAMMEKPLIFIGKSEIKKFPFIGRWFQDIGCLFLERADNKKSLKVINEGIDRIRRGYSVVIFPEGGRTNVDGVKDFKPGSFKLAARTNVRIVPVTFYNSEACYEKTHWFQPADVRIRIGEIVDPQALELQSTVQMAKHLHTVISQDYEEMKK
ncbi:MAG: 1-acyl-sn-glycerol-3-phosphate acyltransferase [Lachnospiraceae bacterium]|nr:1-acyl-sn-glycerol-3-phosphate acyltransferase [Lachnospiraceae bacterium]